MPRVVFACGCVKVVARLLVGFVECLGTSCCAAEPRQGRAGKRAQPSLAQPSRAQPRDARPAPARRQLIPGQVRIVFGVIFGALFLSFFEPFFRPKYANIGSKMGQHSPQHGPKEPPRWAQRANIVPKTGQDSSKTSSANMTAHGLRSRDLTCYYTTSPGMT